jgi:methyl-accepting chemotaxis protein
VTALQDQSQTRVRFADLLTSGFAERAILFTTGDALATATAKDEIGAMARAVEVFKQNAIENGRMSAEQTRERALKDRRQAANHHHTRDFSATVSGVLATLVESAASMRAAAGNVSSAAGRTRVKTSSSVDSATASAQDLNSVAAAAEEMASSINEISRQVSHVTRAVEEAVTKASATDLKVAGLSETAERIGDVVRLIDDIAGQTNLLALNATIEAERAGDAGKGFAVVAGEVKALAAQTAKATQQISSQILEIRTATGEAVTAVREMGAAIGQVEAVATAIAAAVEQQAAATREITSSVQTVTAATGDTVLSMRDILTISQETETTSQMVLTAADKVGLTADSLHAEVNDFLAAMKREEAGDRRSYERFDGHGVHATVSVAGQPDVTAPIQEISRSAVALGCRSLSPVGTDVKVNLTGAGGPVSSRIVRAENGTLVLSFRQDAATMARVETAIEILGRSVSVAA